MPPSKPSIVERLALPFKVIYWRWFWKVPDLTDIDDEASACWWCEFAGRDKLECEDCHAPEYRNYRRRAGLLTCYGGPHLHARCRRGRPHHKPSR